MYLSIMVLNSLALVFSMLYCFSKLLDKQYDFRNKSIYISYLIIVIINLLCWFFIENPLRVVILTFVFCLFSIIQFKETISKSLLVSIFYQLIVMLSETLVVVIIISIVGANTNELLSQNLSLLITNFCVSVFSILLVNLPFIIKLIRYLINATNKINKNLQLIIYLIIILIADFFGLITYYKVSMAHLLIFNSVYMLFCAIIVIYSLKEKEKNIELYIKYDNTLNSLKEYETILNQYKIETHENKNQLLTIRNLIPKNNKKIISYIDQIVENKLKDNNRIMAELSILPSGGLRGLIYSKVLLMKNKNITYSIEYSREIKTADLIKIDDSLMLDICQIIGVFLDNAIEAVQELEESVINIQFYMENSKLIISISNNFVNLFNSDSIDDVGYTTKGNNHGYGLPLVKKILKSNKRITNTRNITNNCFKQVLNIEI